MTDGEFLNNLYLLYVLLTDMQQNILNVWWKKIIYSTLCVQWFKILIFFNQVLFSTGTKRIPTTKIYDIHLLRMYIGHLSNFVLFVYYGRGNQNIIFLCIEFEIINWYKFRSCDCDVTKWVCKVLIRDKRLNIPKIADICNAV